MGPAAADTSASLTHINANLTFVFGEIAITLKFFTR